MLLPYLVCTNATSVSFSQLEHVTVYLYEHGHDSCRLAMIPPKASYERLIAGGLAGAISRTCVAPFERLRTILMTNSSVSFLEASKKILKADGILGEVLLLLQLSLHPNKYITLIRNRTAFLQAFGGETH